METAKKITGVDFKVVYGPRRPGDPDKLLASSEKIKSELGWKPIYDNLEEIISTAWKWQKIKEEK
jgi:UDP-glucose 4-epimerase